MPQQPSDDVDFQQYPDLANRALAGSVIWASDESFAERENLIMPHEPAFDPDEFGNKGKVYDGWETRRRRHDEIGKNDAAIVRLGVSGLVRGIVVDTAWFKGNFPPQFAVKGLCLDEYLPADEIAAIPDEQWLDLVPATDAEGDHKHAIAISPDSPAGQQRITHVRLDMIPDGGIARVRVHGIPTPDPRFLTSGLDLAATENGGWVTECSNMFYSSPNQTLGLGRALNMGGGWENARRRGDGNDYFTVQLAGEGLIEHVEIDTSYFVFNAPGEVQLTGITADGEEIAVVPKTRALPDTRHRFLASEESRGVAFTHVRVDVFPDGGLARLRVFGRLSDEGRDTLARRWG